MLFSWSQDKIELLFSLEYVWCWVIVMHNLEDLGPEVDLNMNNYLWLCLLLLSLTL